MDATNELVNTRLATASITRMAQVVYATNVVLYLELDDSDPTHPDQPLRAIYKAAQGERRLWDFPPATLYRREVAAYLVDAALDLGFVPPTVLRDGPLGPGSVQLFVDVSDGSSPHSEATVHTALRELAVFDALVNNADRKSAHILPISKDLLPPIRAIDNGLSFLPYPHQRTVLLELSGSSIPQLMLDRLTNLRNDTSALQNLTDRLSTLLNDDEVAAFLSRLDTLIETQRYPELDPWEAMPYG